MAPERMRGPGRRRARSRTSTRSPRVAYELLSGEPPLDTASTEAMTPSSRPTSTDGLAAPRRRRPRCSSVASTRTRRRRPATATRLVDELDSALAGDVDGGDGRWRPFEPPPSRAAVDRADRAARVPTAPRTRQRPAPGDAGRRRPAARRRRSSRSARCSRRSRGSRSRRRRRGRRPGRAGGRERTRRPAEGTPTQQDDAPPRPRRPPRPSRRGAGRRRPQRPGLRPDQSGRLRGRRSRCSSRPSRRSRAPATSSPTTTRSSTSARR